MLKIRTIICVVSATLLAFSSLSFAGEKEQEYTVRIRIDYSIGSSVFETKDFVIINL